MKTIIMSLLVILASGLGSVSAQDQLTFTVPENLVSAGNSFIMDKLQFRFEWITGVTTGDIHKFWWEEIDREFDDWSRFTYGFNLQALYGISQNFFLGLEFGTHRLFWYSYQATGYSWYYEDEYWRDHFGVLGEYSNDRFYSQFGLNGGTGNGSLCLAGGTKIHLKGRFYLPLGLRADWIFDENAPLSTYSITLGLLFH